MVDFPVERGQGGGVCFSANSICQVRPPGGRSVVGSSDTALTGGSYYISVLGFVPKYLFKKYMQGDLLRKNEM